jgi:serine/threonine protein kinase
VGGRYLQHAQIAHRDLKLQNLLLDESRQVLKLSDFGTAQPTWGEKASASGVGTPQLWAPELWMAEECDAHKLDMWACGCLLYRLPDVSTVKWPTGTDHAS